MVLFDISCEQICVQAWSQESPVHNVKEGQDSQYQINMTYAEKKIDTMYAELVI